MYQDLNQRLNLLIESPKFAYRVYPDGATEVLSPLEIPIDDLEYWVGAKITLRNGHKIDGAFVLRNGGGEQVRIYFRINGAWKTSDNKKVPDLLSLPREEIFPIEWTYNLPVANDMFHQ